jgi:glucosamine kinase
VLGHRAARRALLAHEQVAAASPFTTQVMARFEQRPALMLEWALQAIPRDWATFAPQLFAAAESGDPVAAELLHEGVAEVAGLLDRLNALGALRIALLGGLAALYRPHLPARFGALLVEPAGDALDGALRLARTVQTAAPARVAGGAAR